MTNLTYLEYVAEKRLFGWNYVPPGSVHSFAFEEIDLKHWSDVIESTWKLPFYIGPAYLATIFGIQWWMRDRPAYQLKTPLFLWNLGLGIFSIVAFARTAPGFVQQLLKPNGFYNSMCVKDDLSVPMVYWIILFAVSKFVELGDTIFIVLRKRPLVFLQWYHHLVTLTVVWILAPLGEPICRWYTVLNYGVHSFMYPYFALRAIGVRIPHSIANLITTLQLVQMVMGFVINVLSTVFRQMGYDCVRHPTSIRAFMLVYATFLVLFGKLFVDSVLLKGRQRRDRPAKKID